MAHQRGSLVEQLERFFEENDIEEIEHEHPNEWKIETKNGAEYKASTLKGALAQVPGTILLLERPRTPSRLVWILAGYGPSFFLLLLLALPRLRRTLSTLLRSGR
jgi:hypothetical protein